MQTIKTDNYANDVQWNNYAVKEMKLDAMIEVSNQKRAVQWQCQSLCSPYNSQYRTRSVHKNIFQDATINATA